MKKNRTIIIIPARFKSTRYPGKPLAKLLGRPSIQWTYETALTVHGVDEVYVATDDDHIREAAEEVGAKVVMTGEECRNGTERVAEAAKKLSAKDSDIIINFQGDAPLTPPWFVEGIIEEIQTNEKADMVTPVLKCSREHYLALIEDRKHNRVGATTAVFDSERRALYFSKEVIPYLPSADTLAEWPVYHHVGVYAYRMSALAEYPSWPVGVLEQAEQLEQLRFLEMGKAIYVREVDARGREFWELNNPEDISVIEAMMERNLTKENNEPKK
ncbi:3-deoxy-manno-octulosonate cytidylyltransferase [bacterium]|nr:3-deoxy-manno-octulosonate cytidylyltransferase [bacterium]